MEAISAFIQGFAYFGDPMVWVFVLLGMVLGIVFGILPGVSGLTAMALLLPFVFHMKAEYALAAFAVITATSATGGSITAILLNVPGDTANAATLLDGYPMTKKGEGGRALGAALMSHAVGGFSSMLICILLIPLVLPLMYAMKTGDLVFIILFAFSCVGVLSSEAPLKGMIACLVGVMLAFVGTQVQTGEPRYTFDSIYLLSGIPVASFAMGLFALTEMLDLSVEGGSIAPIGKIKIPMRMVVQGCVDVFKHWSLWIRGTIIGLVIGIMPGVGTSASPWMAYGQAKATSKHPELYGTGYVGGVIAPELCVGAVVPGDLLTTLALGIPGSVQMVMVLSALITLGITPGPSMLQSQLPLTFSVMQVFIIGKLIAVFFCLLLAVQLAKVATIPGHYLVPLATLIIFVGSYATEGRFYDLIILLLFMVVGMFMREFGFAIPPLVIGFVLGDLFEKYLSIAINNAGPFFWVRPISLTLICLNLLIIFWPQISSLWSKDKKGASAA